MDPMIILIAVVVLLLLVWVIGMYNGLVKLRQQCRESWSVIDTELKRRYDLIPNLVETVKGYAQHESGVLQTRDRGAEQGCRLDRFARQSGDG